MTGSTELSMDQQKLIFLLGQCAAGDESAFSDLYRGTSSHLYAVILRMLDSTALADEALQETYIKVWSRASYYQPDLGTPNSWLTNVARNTAIDLLRSQRSRRVHDHDSDEQAMLALDKLAMAATSESDHLKARQLHRCLSELQPEVRDCVLLSYCEGYTHSELTRRLNRPMGTIKSWIRRALIGLKECMNEYT